MIHFDTVSKVYSNQRLQRRSLRDFLALARYNPLDEEESGAFLALDHVGFSISEGEAVAIVGCNGSGKSTLLKLLSRIILPSSGRIRVNGTISSLLEVGTGFHHELTGFENIFLCGAILGMGRSQVRQKLEAIIEFSEIREFIHVPVKFYSSGMYLRLAFAVGVHLDADILVIDEVLAVGDARFQEKCIDKIHRIKAQGKTIVLVSHDERQIRALCSRCLVMDHGRLIYSGETSQALSVYQRILTTW